MDTPIKRLKFGMGRSVQNLSLGQIHVNSSFMRYFGFIVTSYGVRRFLEEVEVAQAVALLESGYTQRIVAEHFDVSKSCQAMETLPGDR